MKTKFKSFCLTALLMLFGQASLWAYGAKIDGIYYYFSSTNATVTYQSWSLLGDYPHSDYGGNVVIPATVSYNGKAYSVTSIGEGAFYDCTGLTSIEIPSSVTSIRDSAFYGCSGLTSIEIRSGVTSIGNSAFKNCLGLTSIEIPSSVTSIGDSAFWGCTGLTSIEIPSGVTSIGDSAFLGCTGLTSIEIPSSVTSIGNSAFYGCSGLTSIEIPSSVTSIGNNTFYGCLGLTGIEIPSSVTSIGDYAFYYCSKLTSIEIPSCVTSIGYGAFEGCTGLTSIEIPSGVTSIGEWAFSSCSGLTSIEIQSSGTSIGNRAFSSCSGLTRAEFTSVESLCSISFGDIYANPLYYANHLYINGEEITEIVIPSSVTSIGNYAFWGCTGLTSVEIPSSVTSIGNRAFYGCSGLTRAEFASVESLCSISFESSDANPLYYANHLYINGEEITEIVIPSSVTSIGNYAFWGCTGLTSVEIPSSVTSIGDWTFYGCSKLTSVTVNNPTPISISSDVFSNRANATLYVPAGSKSAYEAAPYWQEFGEIREFTNEIEIADGTALSFDEPATYTALTYSRTFSSTQWQSLYVPFAIPVDSLTKQGLQVAELNDTHQWDLNGDGVADSTRVEFFTLTSGSTLANYPYLIRANDAPKTFTLRMEDIEVAATEENSYECSSFKQRFTVVGTYAGVSGQEMWDNNYYGMSGGGLKRVSNATVSLKPQRWYMKVENKNGDPVTYYAASLRIAIDGIDEMPEATDIRMVCGANGEAVIYGIDGVRYRQKPSKPGFYLQRGKKIFIR